MNAFLTGVRITKQCIAQRIAQRNSDHRNSVRPSVNSSWCYVQSDFAND